MADQENMGAGSPTPSGEDTQTRKTVKLKVPAAVTAAAASPGIADPLSSRDTDTGNLDVMSDTQTRKTVKLKPIAPLDKGATLGGAINRPTMMSTPAASAPLSGGGTGTQTRKVVMLKTVPAKNTPVDPVAEAAPAPAPAAPAVDDATVKVQKVAAPVMPSIQTEGTGEDATVKIKRPEKSIIPAAAAPAAETEKPTVKIEPPKLVKKAAPEAPAAPAVPAPAAEAPAEAVEKEETIEKNGLGLKKDAGKTALPPKVAADMAELGLGGGGIVPRSRSGQSGPSALYTILAVISAACLLVTAALSVIQYLNIGEGQNIQIPVLSDQIK
jgi:hypothetical protein